MGITKATSQRNVTSNTDKSLVVSDELREFIKIGRAYFCSDVFSIGSGEKKYVLFNPIAVVSSLPDFHGKIIAYAPMFYTSLGPVIVNFRVGHDYSNGTLLNLRNMNELSSNTPLSEIREDPTGSNIGTKENAYLVGGGDTAVVAQHGGSNDLRFPFIINTTFTRLVEIVNQSGKTIIFQYNCTLAEF